MYKVLIVDDEKIVRIALKTIINWEEFDLQLIGSAPDGLAALKIIKNHTPDIIITDLKMPKLDGIELIKKLNQMTFTGKIVVLSNYSDYELVRQALKLGAYDYLLKLSLNNQEFSDLMKKLTHLLDEEHLRSNDRILQNFKDQQKKELVNSIFIKEILCDQSLSHDEIQLKAKKLGFSYENAHYFMFEIILDSFSIRHKAKIEEPHLMTFAVANIVTEIVGQKHDIECVDLANDRFVIIVMSQHGLEKKDIINLGKVIKRSIQMYLSIKATIIIGSQFSGISELKKVYDECQQMSQVLFYKGYDNIIDTNQTLIASDSELETLVLKTTDAIKELFNNRAFDQINYEIYALFTYCINKYIKPSYLIKNLNRIIHVVDRKLLEVMDVQHYFLFRDQQASLSDAATIDELKEIVTLYFTNVNSALQKVYHPQYRAEVEQVINYIKKNLSKKITLDQIAGYVNLNESYLCRLFKQETGFSIMNYLNNMRMEQAGKLLILPQTKIKDVAITVGIQDPLYFYKIFKKYYGMSPSDYKKKMSP